MRWAVALLSMAIGGAAYATACGTGFYPFPFTDVAALGDAFCPGIMEAYVTGVTKGTTATTFSPNTTVDRTQMTTFLQRSMDQGLRRNNRRAALGQWWTSKTSVPSAVTSLVGPGPASFCKSDGERIWVGNGDRILSFLTSSGEKQGEMTLSFAGVNSAGGMVVARGKTYFTDPVTANMGFVVSNILPPLFNQEDVITYSFHPNNLTFDGDNLWTANFGDGSVAKVPLVAGGSLPTAGAIILTPGFSQPIDILYDGSNVWVVDAGTAMLHKLNPNGTVAQSVAVGASPGYMVYDGANIWVPSHANNSITVVQASTGAITATITSTAANGLNTPLATAFDGERVLVTNPGNDSVTLFRAADLSLIGNVSLAAVGLGPFGACSDGIDFWIVLATSKLLVRL